MRLCNTDLQINCFTFSHLYVVVQLVWIAAFLVSTKFEHFRCQPPGKILYCCFGAPVLCTGALFCLIGKSLFLKRLKKYVSSKRGIENRRLLEKIKTFFSKVVVIIEFMKKIVHVQKIAVAHMFNIMSCHAFWRILNVLQSKFLCKFFCVCSIQK